MTLKAHSIRDASPPHQGPGIASLPICFSIPELHILLLSCLHNKSKYGSGPGFLPDEQTSKWVWGLQEKTLPLSICVPIASYVSGFLSDRVMKGGGNCREKGESPKWFAISQSWEWMGEARWNYIFHLEQHIRWRMTNLVQEAG